MNRSLSAATLLAGISALHAADEGFRSSDAEERRASYQLRYLGDPVLTTVCEPVTTVLRVPKIPTGLLDAMRATLNPFSSHRSLPDRRPGLGLAANQLGVLLRVIVVKLGNEPHAVAMFNPVLTKRSAEKTHGADGCLSIPGFQTNSARHNTVTVTYLNERWEQQTIALSSLSSRVVQHEIDHLDGRLITDGASRQLRRNAERAVEKARGLA